MHGGMLRRLEFALSATALLARFCRVRKGASDGARVSFSARLPLIVGGARRSRCSERPGPSQPDLREHGRRPPIVSTRDPGVVVDVFQGARPGRRPEPAPPPPSPLPPPALAPSCVRPPGCETLLLARIAAVSRVYRNTGFWPRCGAGFRIRRGGHHEPGGRGRLTRARRPAAPNGPDAGTTTTAPAPARRRPPLSAAHGRGRDRTGTRPPGSGRLRTRP